MGTARFEVAPAAADHWDDVVELFERPGPRGGRQDTANCWCVVWRSAFGDVQENKRRLCALVTEGAEPGLVAYQKGEPVGWVSIAPREQFPSLLRSSQYRPRDSDDGVFLLSCFHVDRRARGQGLSHILLDSAVQHAVARGATAIDAYPAEPADYKGKVSWFLDYGFEVIRDIGKRTHVRFPAERK